MFERLTVSIVDIITTVGCGIGTIIKLLVVAMAIIILVAFIGAFLYTIVSETILNRNTKHFLSNPLKLAQRLGRSVAMFNTVGVSETTPYEHLGWIVQNLRKKGDYTKRLKLATLFKNELYEKEKENFLYIFHYLVNVSELNKYRNSYRGIEHLLDSIASSVEGRLEMQKYEMDIHGFRLISISNNNDIITYEFFNSEESFMMVITGNCVDTLKELSEFIDNERSALLDDLPFFPNNFCEEKYIRIKAKEVK